METRIQMIQQQVGARLTEMMVLLAETAVAIGQGFWSYAEPLVAEAKPYVHTSYRYTNRYIDWAYNKINAVPEVRLSVWASIGLVVMAGVWIKLLLFSVGI